MENQKADTSMELPVIDMGSERRRQEVVATIRGAAETWGAVKLTKLTLSFDFPDGTVTLRCHYYPSCPQKDDSSGLKMHSDITFITILLQDNVGGFQVLREGSWVDVPSQRGSLIVNIGDLMQLVTKDKYKSAVHRVMGAVDHARVSAACFFMPGTKAMSKKFSPIKSSNSCKENSKSSIVKIKLKCTCMRSPILTMRDPRWDGTSTQLPSCNTWNPPTLS